MAKKEVTNQLNQLESDVKNNRSTSQNALDVKYAKKHLDSLMREKDRLSK